MTFVCDDHINMLSSPTKCVSAHMRIGHTGIKARRADASSTMATLLADWSSASVRSEDNSVIVCTKNLPNSTLTPPELGAFAAPTLPHIQVLIPLRP